MKKIFYSLFFLCLGGSVYAATVVSETKLDSPKTCEDVGAVTTPMQAKILIGAYYVHIGESQNFCVLYENNMQSAILASTLLSKTPSLAASAYRNGPKPYTTADHELDGRGDRLYCKRLGGTYQFGEFGQVGGWMHLEDGDVDSICVFSDGSMIASWTLFYKRLNKTNRPDFDAAFQNQALTGLW